MFLTFFALVFSAILIYFSCELFVNAIEWVGMRFNISKNAVGTILAALGTGLPESVVTLIAVVFGTYVASFCYFVISCSSRFFDEKSVNLKNAESGREILLYRIQPGETCVIMLSSALGNIPYPATAIVEQDVEALMISNEIYKYWLQHIPAVQAFTYQSLARRLGTVMALIEEITFKRLDIRLIRFLLEHTSEKQATVYKTHEELAIELGTAREVISRLLKNLEGDHLLMLSRSKIEITKRQELEKMLLNR